MLADLVDTADERPIESSVPAGMRIGCTGTGAICDNRGLGRGDRHCLRRHGLRGRGNLLRGAFLGRELGFAAREFLFACGERKLSLALGKLVLPGLKSRAVSFGLDLGGFGRRVRRGHRRGWHGVGSRWPPQPASARVATAAESIVAAFKVGFMRIGDLLNFQTGRPPNP